MVSSIRAIGKTSLGYCQTLGRASILLALTVIRRHQLKAGLRFAIEQMYSLGVLSVIIIFVSSLFIGMVLGLQGYNTLNKFGVTQELGQLVALSVVRELGPVVTALLYAGRAGSALTAEIGLMKTTDQLASMEMMGVDPLQRIILPRLLGGIISLPILTCVFNVIAILGGYFVGVIWLGIDDGSFWGNMQAAVDLRIDVISGLIKGLIFGMAINWIAVYQGYDCQPNAAGISKATTNTVVYSSLAVLGLDFILTALMLGGW